MQCVSLAAHNLGQPSVSRKSRGGCHESTLTVTTNIGEDATLDSMPDGFTWKLQEVGGKLVLCCQHAGRPFTKRDYTRSISRELKSIMCWQANGDATVSMVRCRSLKWREQAQIHMSLRRAPHVEASLGNHDTLRRCNTVY